MLQLLDTLSRIAIEHAPLLGPAIAFVLLVLARQHLGRWPDLWRARRIVLPIVADVGEGEFEEPLDELTDTDIEGAIPEKTRLPLQDQEFAGVIDAPPSVVREDLRSMPRVWPASLASIQYDVVDGERVYEVGSYAYRPAGFLAEWQYHVRLTPRDGGRQTALWAHRERSPWARPRLHYKGQGWDADAGVREIATLFASDRRYAPSDRAIELVATGAGE
ncbi:hypothetical protein [Haloparvum sedimenti]|uniref:hypothetical protein n=1 Tax=Haloparvum sedimenti TaxID=1678448 RepID=UPI00071E7859|nr:hypothetical protein [Haloparvum sedimenti]